MGYLTWPRLADAICKKKCEHTDCAEWKRRFLAGCSICKKTIGQGEKVYAEEGDKFAHMLCVLKRDDEECECEHAAMEHAALIDACAVPGCPCPSFVKAGA